MDGWPVCGRISLMPDPSSIVTLAERQLAAYNAADLDAFCACYHPEVRMFEGEELTAEGRPALRERYADMFAASGFGAAVPQRAENEVAN